MTPIPARPLILIVDDNPINLSVLANTLTSNGFEIAVEPDGESAIAQVESSPPDLILLDVQMPGIDGFETCQRLKVNPSTHDIPIIFITALADTTDKVKGFSLGAVDYITKPFQQEEVLVRVQLHLKLRFLTKTLEQQNIQLKNEIKQRLQAEAQLHETLQQLQSAQKQIVAKEKLSSLGALTAGVAHEIRNPLNFVNNYAESSVELTEELLEEIDRRWVLAVSSNTPKPVSLGDDRSEHSDRNSLNYIKEMLTDIRDNAAAIHQHGQRAENIIHSMMQHARTDSGHRQPTELNALLDRAVQLAYHSRRATDNRFNVTIYRDYDRDLGQWEVVSSDLNRAFINIIDNACYAVREKQKHDRQESGKEVEVFTPKLWVKTRNLGEAAEIRIRDNGIGIPPEVREKIFHPFFTTKPAGEGTGLGLSLTYDIIAEQHGGTLNVETEPGEYTEFIIRLPKAWSVFCE